jgi:hypothetical protein
MLLLLLTLLPLQQRLQHLLQQVHHPQQQVLQVLLEMQPLQRQAQHLLLLAQQVL